MEVILLSEMLVVKTSCKKVLDKMFSDLGWVDCYFTRSVSEDKVNILIYTTYDISSEDKEFDILIDRLSLAEKILEKEIIWDTSSVTYSYLYKVLRSFYVWKGTLFLKSRKDHCNTSSDVELLRRAEEIVCQKAQKSKSS